MEILMAKAPTQNIPGPHPASAPNPLGAAPLGGLGSLVNGPIMNPLGMGNNKDDDDRTVFSDIDPETETTGETIFERRFSHRNTWGCFFSELYNHECRIKLEDLENNLIGKMDRDGTLRDMLEESGMEEKKDWWFDDEENFLYLCDESFLLIWKITNCAQIEQTVIYIEEHCGD